MWHWLTWKQKWPGAWHLPLGKKQKLGEKMILDVSFSTSTPLTFGEGNGTPLHYSCLENPMDGGAWEAAVHGVAKSRTWLSDFTFTFHFLALEKEMATHSSVLAWRIPGMGEPGGLPSMGSHRVGHNWSDVAILCCEVSCVRCLGASLVHRCTTYLSHPYKCENQASPDIAKLPLWGGGHAKLPPLVKNHCSRLFFEKERKVKDFRRSLVEIAKLGDCIASPRMKKGMFWGSRNQASPSGRNWR